MVFQQDDRPERVLHSKAEIGDPYRSRKEHKSCTGRGAARDRLFEGQPGRADCDPAAALM